MKLGYYERGAEGEVDTQMKYGRENDSKGGPTKHLVTSLFGDKEVEIRKDDGEISNWYHLGTASNSRD